MASSDGPISVGGKGEAPRPPQAPSIGDQLLELRIDRYRRSGSLAINELLIHQLPEPVERVGTACVTERQQKPAAGALQSETAMGKGLDVGAGRARRPWKAQRRALPSGGAGSRTRTAGLARDP
jgi:hypothetical protein